MEFRLEAAFTIVFAMVKRVPFLKVSVRLDQGKNREFRIKKCKQGGQKPVFSVICIDFHIFYSLRLFFSFQMTDH